MLIHHYCIFLYHSVDKVMEHMDNVNIRLKKSITGVMAGDKFLVNCVLLCVLLALIAYIASVLTGQA